MGRHSMPEDPAQSDAVTVELAVVPSYPTPRPGSRHGGYERARREWWPRTVSQDGTHEAPPRRARGHRTAPLALHAFVGSVAVFALSVSAGMALEDRVDTVRPQPAPLEGRFASLPSPGVGQAPGASTASPRVTVNSPRPVTVGTSGRVPSKSPGGDTPEPTRQSRTPAVTTSPGGGSPAPTKSASPAADPTGVPEPDVTKPDWDCPW